MASATLKVHRKRGALIDYNRTYEVELDGVGVGTIGPGDTVEVPIEPGGHRLRVHHERHVSPTRSFDAADGEMVSFWCRTTRFWPRYFAAMIKPELWIALRREGIAS